MKSFSQHSPDVLIIGGGVAGLAAAVELTSRGHSILLIEQKPKLGGRTYSFIHPETGDEVDNGQHLMMGCYFSTLRYLKMIDAMDMISIQRNLSIIFRHEQLGVSSLKAVSFPAPFNVLIGLLRLKNLSLKNRISLLRVGVELLIKNPETNSHLQSITVSQWLDEMQQSKENRKYLWDVIAIGALNDSPEKISAALFVKVLKTAFFGRRMNSSLVIPKKGLSTVLVDKGVEFIENHGGIILTQTSIERIEYKNQNIENVFLDSGMCVRPKAVISAIPYYDIDKVFDEHAVPEIRGIDNFVSSPIVTIHLWFDAHFMKEEFVALLDSPLHWVFNKTKIFGNENKGLMYLAIVVSGAFDFVEKDKEEIVLNVHKELKRFYPTASVAKIIHSLVIKEKRATFSPTVDIQKKRPEHSTSIKNLFLAGDWTGTKLPATIEGAIQSGFACAKNVMDITQNKS